MTAPATKPARRHRRHETADEYAARTIPRDLDSNAGLTDDAVDYLACDLTTPDDVERAMRGGLRSVGWEYVS